jgi:fumarate hydratase subunit alpha
MVRHPLDRKNTGDNTPAALHVELTEGDQLKIAILPKGGGCENMSQFRMLTPGMGAQGVTDFVLECVRRAGPNPCPPVILGVGVGGTFDGSAWLAKRALFRRAGSHSSDPTIAQLENDLLRLVNETGIGPSGLGGRTTALAVHVEWRPCHITSLPVSVCFNCHAARYQEAVL